MNSKIQMIKSLRGDYMYANGMRIGLKEAKDFVEACMEANSHGSNRYTELLNEYDRLSRDFDKLQDEFLNARREASLEKAKFAALLSKMSKEDLVKLLLED